MVGSEIFPSHINNNPSWGNDAIRLLLIERLHAYHGLPELVLLRSPTFTPLQTAPTSTAAKNLFFGPSTTSCSYFLAASSELTMSQTSTQEPRFSLPESTPRSSKTELVIGGLNIYIYGLDDLKNKSGADIAVLLLAHNRTRTYLVTEGIAHEVLNRYRTDGRNKKLELIAVTFNERNHGDREVRCYIHVYF